MSYFGAHVCPRVPPCLWNWCIINECVDSIFLEMFTDGKNSSDQYDPKSKWENLQWNPSDFFLRLKLKIFHTNADNVMSPSPEFHAYGITENSQRYLKKINNGQIPSDRDVTLNFLAVSPWCMTTLSHTKIQDNEKNSAKM